MKNILFKIFLYSFNLLSTVNRSLRKASITCDGQYKLEEVKLDHA